MATDEAAREYTLQTPIQERTALGIWEAIKTAIDKFVKAIHAKDFDKYLAMANPKNGNDFLKEVQIHF